jgi:hypothetical protein
MLVPNPNNGNFSIVGMPEDSRNTIQLINSLGQIIEQIELTDTNYSFSELNLTAGVYFVIVNNEETIKICVSKSN